MDHLIVVVDSGLGSLVKMKELLREISFPSNSVHFQESVGRCLANFGSDRAPGTYRLVMAEAETVFADQGKLSFP
jgi:hypothetical protein